MLDWLAFRLCDLAAWFSWPTWAFQQYERRTRESPRFVSGVLLNWPYRRMLPNGQWAVMYTVFEDVPDGWRPGRYV